uniref:Uncharacterized protein n=1 Tax=viral metagenome TaxID=1070528 RepID=A0A6C0F7Q2_9ZZZZ
MLNNSFVFSLILSIINTVFLYLFTNSSSEFYEEKNGNKTNVLVLLFGITFATSFALKSLSNQSVQIPKVSIGGDTLSYSSRPPF